MCNFEIRVSDFDEDGKVVRDLLQSAADTFGDAVILSNDRLSIPADARAITRLVARHFDAYVVEAGRHASTI